MIKRSECSCQCHRLNGCVHVVPCCEPDPVVFSFKCTCPEDWQGKDHTAGCKMRSGITTSDSSEITI